MYGQQQNIFHSSGKEQGNYIYVFSSGLESTKEFRGYFARNLPEKKTAGGVGFFPGGST